MIESEVLKDFKKLSLMLEEKDQQIKSLEHRLANCIEPKFKIGQEVWTIKIKELAELRIENICYSSDHIIRYHLKDSKCFLFRCEHEIFATKEEALKRLEEMKSE